MIICNSDLIRSSFLSCLIDILHLYFYLNDTLIQKSLYSIIPINRAPNNSAFWAFQQLEVFFNLLEPSLVRSKKVLKYSKLFYQPHRPVFPDKSNLCNRAEMRAKCESILLISPLVTSAQKQFSLIWLWVSCKELGFTTFINVNLAFSRVMTTGCNSM